MRQLSLMLIIALLLIGTASSAAKSTFEGWVKSGETFSVQNQTYKVMHLRDQNITVINFPTGQTTVIYMGNRTCSREWIYSVCETKQRYEKYGQAVLPSINDPKIDIFVYLILNISKVDLEIDKPSMPMELFIGDPVKVTVGLNMTGEEEIYNISFVDRYPDSFLINDVVGCKASTNYIYFEGNLNISRHICTFSLTPTKPGIYNSSSNVTYVALGKTMNKAKTIVFSVNDTPIRMKVSGPNRTIHTGQNSSINITLEVLKDMDIDRMEIRLPGHLRIMNYTKNLTARETLFSVSNLQLAKRSKTTFVIAFTSILEKNGTSNISVRYTDNGLLKSIESQHAVNYEGDFFEIGTFEKNGTWYLSLGNPYEYIFSEIEVTVGDEKLVQGILRPYEIYFLPMMQRSSYATIRYRMENGQLLTKMISLNITDDIPENITSPGSPNASDGQQAGASDSGSGFVFLRSIKREHIYVGSTVIAILIMALILSKIKFGRKSKLDQEIEELRKREKAADKEKAIAIDIVGKDLGAEKQKEETTDEATHKAVLADEPGETKKRKKSAHKKKKICF